MLILMLLWLVVLVLVMTMMTIVFTERCPALSWLSCKFPTTWR